MSLFEGIEFGITGRGKDVTVAKALIEEHGGAIATREHNRLKAMIVGVSGPSQKKIASAAKLGVPQVTVQWLEDCVKAGKFLPPPAIVHSSPPSTSSDAAGSKKMSFDFDDEDEEDNVVIVKGNAKKPTTTSGRLSSTPPALKMHYGDVDVVKKRTAQSPPPKKGALFPRNANTIETSGTTNRKDESSTSWEDATPKIHSVQQPPPAKKDAQVNKPNVAPTNKKETNNDHVNVCILQPKGSAPNVEDCKLSGSMTFTQTAYDARPVKGATKAQQQMPPWNGGLDSVFPSKQTISTPPTVPALSSSTTTKAPDSGPSSIPGAKTSLFTTHSSVVSKPTPSNPPAPRNTCVAAPPRPSSFHGAKHTTTTVPSTTAAPRETSAPTTPTGTAQSRIHASRKPAIPKFTKEAPPLDENSPEAMLGKVMQHPAGKGLENEFVKTILNQIVDTASPVTFSDIAGLENCKQILKEVIVLPARRPDLFEGLRAPCTGLLLFGPPGNGKTMLAKALACECQTTFFNISASAITSKWVGESEKLVRTLFGVARALAPSTIFIDEIDSLLQVRGSSAEMEGSRRLKTEFLCQVDGAGNDFSACRVLVMGATNRPFDIDDAALRRFPKRVLVPLPDYDTRLHLLQYKLKEQKCDLTPQQWCEFAKLTEFYSGSDMSNLCKDLAMAPLRNMKYDDILNIKVEDIRPVNFADVKTCLKNIRPSASKKQLETLQQWNNEYGSSE